MHFTRLTTDFDKCAFTGDSLCSLLHNGAWLIEAGHVPPPAHRPERLLADWPSEAAAAISLSTATLLEHDLGQAIMAWVQAAGCDVGPLAGLALHELLLNAAIHGNLEIGSGPSTNWHELSARQAMIADALQDKARCARVLTVAVGWSAQHVAVVIADQGAGYLEPSAKPEAACGVRAAGRGLKIARQAGRLEVLAGGRCAAFLLDQAPDTCLADLPATEPEIPAPIIVLDPDAQEPLRISDWLRSARRGRRTRHTVSRPHDRFRGDTEAAGGA